MKIIADTNTFLAVALEEPEKKKIVQLTVGHDLVAPEVLPFEIGNALTAMMKKRTLEANELTSAWDIVQAIPVELRRIDIRSALEIASRFNIYAYDAYFIECAISLRCPLLTLDRPMKIVGQNVGIHILE
ncbi:MAG: type II toxin-antitoxin system VapC family toxin [Deltaproteobacteria bacterium]|nr:type II toxin-antitoxin system VapC family toxin [Deltaproteobacteria bacterium]MBW1909263.1 type II toxin-antitoxin system VapC family toxin [Deltaproteobacteria bacterium]MBW2035580.1 type II toxin-antitoxin system VapC family toxin [Deltaproteobacteria bacterium]MBW2168889.1 type II toxin-antitoxin system VapC family toxin [Deltaproteobacteria bacterium]